MAEPTKNPAFTALDAEEGLAGDPVDGCDVCEALDAQRTDAIERGDREAARFVAAEIRLHPHKSLLDFASTEGTT